MRIVRGVWARLHALRLFELVLLYVLFDIAEAIVRSAVHYAARYGWWF